MAVLYLVRLIDLTAYILILLVVVSSLLTFFVSPYHPVREALERIVNPMLNPIRRVVPLVGMFDLSPLILIILIQLVSQILTGLLLRL
jgi:YggT family protein